MPSDRVRPILLKLVLAVIVTVTPASIALAYQPAALKQSVDSSGKRLITPETQRAIDRGLEYLAKRQDAAEGSFGSGSEFRRNVAVTGLAGMAFLSAGHTPGRGRYGTNVQRAVDFVLSRAEASGFIIDKSSTSHGPMYGHGFATMFLAEVYGMAPNDDLRNKLEKAIRLIVETQNKEGGWRYLAEPVTYADISVTVCQVMALRAARNCGLSIPKSTIDQSVDYIKRSQNTDGGFRYQLVRDAESAFPRSAAAVVALYSAGLYEAPEIDRGLKYLVAFRPRAPMHQVESQYYYAQYYAVQAMWHAGGEYWEDWYPAVCDDLLRRQEENGSWKDMFICDEYATAMACLVLQMPNNYLPIFQR